MLTVGQWIHAAVTRNVKLLDLVFRPEWVIEMPHCLVTCGSLEVLKLNLKDGRLRFPNSTGFPSLRVLVLNRVTLSGPPELVKAFFKNCPLLEDLSLICIEDRLEFTGLEFLCISCLKLKNLKIDNRGINTCMVRGDLRISCPNLVFLELAGTVAYKYFFESLDSLKKAVIHTNVYYKSERGRKCKVFSGIAHVESLSINMSFLTEECEDPVAVSLPNLKTLEITIVYFTANAVKFIKCFPHLESLYLNIGWDYDLLKYLHLNDAATKRILTCLLKRVDFYNFDSSDRQLKVARFLLEHANALEEMVFCWKCDEAEFHERSMKTMNEVSNFKKASSTVKLIALLNKRPNRCYYNLSSKV